MTEPKDAWGGPATAPGLQRWGMLPLLFGAAGAAGGVTDALASEAVIGQYGAMRVARAMACGPRPASGGRTPS